MEDRGFLSGNEAIARGFYEAGGILATGYPGVPITEALKAIKERYRNIYSEISINDNVALQVSMGASIAGARTMTIMKHTGLNIALDSLMTFTQSYINGGFLITISSDAGAFNSYTEQDIRVLGKYASVGIFAPSDQQEAKDFVKISLEVSEKYSSPIILNISPFICQGKSMVLLKDRIQSQMKSFIPDQTKYVMFPPYVVQAQNRLRERIDALENYAYDSEVNVLEEYEGATVLIVTSSFVYSLLKEISPMVSIYKLGLVYPISTKKVKELSEKYTQIVVLEELYPFIENELKFKGIQCEGKKYFSYTGNIQIEDIYKGLIDAGVIQEANASSIEKDTALDSENVENVKKVVVEGEAEDEVEGEKRVEEQKDEDGEGEKLEKEEEDLGEARKGDIQKEGEEELKEEEQEEDVKNNSEVVEVKEENTDDVKVDEIESESKEVKVENVLAVNDSTTTLNLVIDLNKKPIQTTLRSPSFFAGCPHVPIMNILKGLKALVVGDVGCQAIATYYPWSLSQINMNLGSSMGIVKGIKKILHRKGIEKPLVAIIGDGAFFHSGILGLINLLNQYRREENLTVIILDNKSLASAGWVESPGVKGSDYYEIKSFNNPAGNNQKNPYLDIDRLLKAFGFYDISVVDQFKYKETKRIIKQAIDRPGISIIVAKRPCAISSKIQSAPVVVLNTECRACKECINLHCQAIRMVKNKFNVEKAYIDPIICNGCLLCLEVCPYKAIQKITNLK